MNKISKGVENRLRQFNLDVEFIRLDPVDIIHFPDKTIELPADIESHIELLQGQFPQERENIRAFFTEILRIYRHEYQRKHDSEVLARYQWCCYQDVLDQCFRDERLKAILSGTVGYIGLHPNEVSAIDMACTMMCYFCDGGYLARGGSQALTDSIMRQFVAAGGDLLLNTPVKQIVINEKNQATAVRLASGKEVHARVVVSNADAQQTFFN